MSFDDHRTDAWQLYGRYPRHFLSEEEMAMAIKQSEAIKVDSTSTVSGGVAFYTTISSRLCGESTTALLVPNPDRSRYQFFFSDPQGVISRISGSLVSLYSEMPPSAIIKLARYAHDVASYGDVSEAVARQKGTYGDELRRFLQGAHDHPVRRGSYCLNVLAFFVCLRGLSSGKGKGDDDD